MKKYLILFLLPLFCACDATEEITSDLELEVGTLINIKIGATEATTKVSYEPSADNSIYYFSWEAGDEVSVVVPGTDNTNQKFTAATSEASTTLDGQIATWDGDKNLYAIYPYSALGYTIDSDAQTLFFDNTTQTIDAAAGNSYKNGLMVVAVDGATATAEDNYSIPDLSFTQVMSFFKLDLVDLPEGERCTTIGFEAGADLFIASADVDLATGDVTARTYSSSVSASIDSYTGDSVSFNFALLPVDLSGTAVTLYVTTINDTDTKKYTYQIASGINFAANSFLYSGSGALTLQDNFTESGTGVLYLADFDNGFIPEDDTWVICDTEATTASFTGLKSALDNVYAADSNRRISIEFPYLNAIPNNAFYDSSSTYKYALQSVSAPAALSVGEYAFNDCRSLTTVYSPLATSIGSYAFGSCQSLTAIDFSLVTSISDDAFRHCKALTSVYFPLTTSIGDGAFYGCSYLTTVDFPLATSIDNDAFYSCTSLASVYFPLVVSIGSQAFRSCSSLTSADFPVATSPGLWAFLDCTSLTTVDFPAATSIEAKAFDNCYSLVSINFPLVTTIGDYSFRYCASSLESVEFPLVTSIGEYAFSSFARTSVLKSVSFPLAVTIGECAFTYCESLVNAYFPLATTIEKSAFSSCEALANVTFDSVISIGGYAFQCCYALTYLDLQQLTTIGSNAFRYCYDLTNIDLPLTTSIGSDAFVNCTKLESVDLPSIKSIYSSAFYGCDALRTMSLATNDDTILSTLGTDIFRISDSVTNNENITLTLGLSNKENVVDNTLTVSSNSYTFKQIIFSGGSQSGLTATGSNGTGIAW